jgi:hypothetical protein
MISQSKKRAQTSFEYLAILAIALMVLIPMVYVFQRYALQSAGDIQQSKIRAIGDDIVNTAETIYYMGYPARLTIQEEFPAGIIDMELTSNWSKSTNLISFYTSDGAELAYFCSVNINATITSSAYSAGLKNIIFETRNSSQGNYVLITFK